MAVPCSFSARTHFPLADGTPVSEMQLQSAKIAYLYSYFSCLRSFRHGSPPFKNEVYVSSGFLPASEFDTNHKTAKVNFPTSVYKIVFTRSNLVEKERYTNWTT